MIPPVSAGLKQAVSTASKAFKDFCGKFFELTYEEIDTNETINQIAKLTERLN